MSTYSRDELATFTLQKLASIYPQDEEEEVIVQEVFDQRASVSNYFTLTSLVDVKAKWQEDILQKYIDIKRETMAPENPVSLTPEDEAKLDSSQVTKEIELELQAKLDKYNHPKTKVEIEEVAGDEPEVSEEELDKAIETINEDTPDEVSSEETDETLESSEEESTESEAKVSKQDIISELETRGIEYDGRWGIEKLQELLK